jgi:hypothetical protein
MQADGGIVFKPFVKKPPQALQGVFVPCGSDAP